MQTQNKTGDEAKKPHKSIPRSIFLSLSVVTVAYILLNTSLTLMVPYYSIDHSAPAVSAFGQIGLDWAKVVVGVGATAAITSRFVELVIASEYDSRKI